MKELEGKYVVMAVKIPYQRKDFIYNGILKEYGENEVLFDDIKLGLVVFPKDAIRNIRAMNRMDMIMLAEKYEKWKVRLKLQQLDDKILEKLNRLKRTVKGEEK